MAAQRVVRLPMRLLKLNTVGCHSPGRGPASSDDKQQTVSLPLRARQSAAFTTSQSRHQAPDTTQSDQRESKAPDAVTDFPSPESIIADMPDNAEKHYAQAVMRHTLFKMAEARGIKVPADLYPIADHKARMPRNVQALYLAPMRRAKRRGIVAGTLKIRSFSARNLETMADFALRAAYYLDLPARLRVLPRITERWTVPRSVFVHKKAQENWERITMQRLVTVYDGHPDVVRLWLTFVRRWQWYGVGMRAEVFEDEGIDEWKTMGQSEAEIQAAEEQTKWWLFGRRHDLAGKDAIGQYMDSLGLAARPEPPKSKK